MWAADFSYIASESAREADYMPPNYASAGDLPKFATIRGTVESKTAKPLVSEVTIAYPPAAGAATTN